MRRLLFCAFLLIPFAAWAGISKFATARIVCGTEPTPMRTEISLQTERTFLMRVPGNAANPVYIGRGNVTVDDGLEIAPGETFATGEVLNKGVIYYCIAPAPVHVRIQEANLEIR